MKDFADIPNSSGSFPDVTAVDCSGPGETDGTAIIADTMTDDFGWKQALLDDINETPNDSAETASASQILDAIKTLIARDSSYWIKNWREPDLLGSYSGMDAKYIAINGSQIVIACQNGSDAGILWSEDGFSFYYRTLATSRTVTGIAYGGGYWVVTCSNGSIYYSNETDVYQWVSGYGTWFTENAITGSPYLNGAAYGSGYWIVYGNSGALLYRATDPTSTFTSNTQGSEDLNSAIYESTADVWGVCGDNGTLLYRSTDPTGSFTSNDQGSENLYCITHGTYDGSLLWLTTGANDTLKTAPTVSTGSWTDRTSDAISSTSWWYTGVIQNDHIIICGGDLIAGSYPYQQLEYSSHGSFTFNRLITMVGDNFRDVAYGNNRLILTDNAERVFVSDCHQELP